MTGGGDEKGGRTASGERGGEGMEGKRDAGEGNCTGAAEIGEDGVARCGEGCMAFIGEGGAGGPGGGDWQPMERRWLT